MGQKVDRQNQRPGSVLEDLLKEPSAEKLKDLQIYIPPGPRLGTSSGGGKGISKAFGDKLLFEDLSFMIPRGRSWE